METFIQNTAKAAGQILKSHFKKVGVKYTKKDQTDVVTEADHLSNTYILEQIKKSFPTHAIIGEETGEETGSSEYSWIVDPLDGTFNFATGVPLFGVLLALTKNNQVELACIFDPLQDELFFAKRGAGAFLNGQKIYCSQKTDIPHSAGTIAARLTPQKFPIIEKALSLGKNNTVWINTWGCSAHSALQTACGRRDWTLKENTLLAAPPMLHTQLLKFLLPHTA